MMWFKSKKKKKDTTIDLALNVSDKLRYKVANLQGVGARQRQEDSFTLMNALDEEQYDENGLMFAVCDGMGGMKDGKLASETAVASLRQFFADMDRRGRIAEQLKTSVFKASEEVENLLDGDGGSTVVVGIIYHEQLYFASVGDSFFYLKRDGKLYRLNSEQNVCHERYLENIRDGVFDPIECRNDEEAAALSQFLGMPGLSKVDCSVRPMQLQKGDVLLACSDGVGGVLSEMEVLDALNYESGEQACRELEQRLVEHSKPNQDNYTALLLQCL